TATYTLSLHDALPILRLSAGIFIEAADSGFGEIFECRAMFRTVHGLDEDRIDDDAIHLPAFDGHAQTPVDVVVRRTVADDPDDRSEEHTSELQSPDHL